MMRKPRIVQSRLTLCPIQGQHRTSRGGWTLIEMLVTISVMGTLTGVAVKTLSAMLQSEFRGVEHVARLATVSKMARQFRTDIHAASKFELANVPNKPLLLISVNETRQIQYEIQPAGLLRTEQRGSQSPIRELWRLKQTRFQLEETAGPTRFLTLVVGTLDPHPSQGSSPTATLKELRIDAIVGRDADRNPQR